MVQIVSEYIAFINQAASRIILKLEWSWRIVGNRAPCESQFLENRAARRYPAVNAIDRYSNNLFDRPFSKEDEKGKMVVIRREDDHRTSHGERDEFVGVRQTPGATTYYPLGGRNSPLKRLYSDNPTFPFLRLICPQRRHFNTCSHRITRHKYGRIYAITTWKIVTGVTTTYGST